METNPISDDEKIPAGARLVDWTEPGLYIYRLRLLSDPGLDFWDVSYCYGRIGEEKVRVQLPFSQLNRGTRFRKQPGIKAQIVVFAKKDSLYAVKLGILDNISTLV